MLAKDDAPDKRPDAQKPRRLGRYIVHQELASGGMASVWLACQRGDGDFSRVVAIKQLFPHYAKDPQFVAMFRDEARLAARIRHPNVVSTIDVVAAEGEVFIVMEYIAGESLSRLLSAAWRRKEACEPAIASAVLIGVLEGLHAAHQATNERGVPLKIVHRDMSPQNVIVGGDGIARVVDFGIAKAVGRQQETTQTGQLKGKICYMAPEQMNAQSVDRRCDLWAASVVLWEMLAGKLLFDDPPAALRYQANIDQIPPPSPSLSPALQSVLDRGLARDPDDRFATAREMIVALEKAIAPAPTRHVAQWVQKLARDTLRERARVVEEIEATGPASAAQKTTVPLIAAAVDAAAPRSGAPPPPELPAKTVVMVSHPSVSPPTTAITSAIDAVTEPARRSGRVMLAVAIVALLAAMGFISFGTALRRSVARVPEPTPTPLPSASDAAAALPMASATSSAGADPPASSTAAPRAPTSAPSPHSTIRHPRAPTRTSAPAASVPGDPLDHDSRK